MHITKSINKSAITIGVTVFALFFGYMVTFESVKGNILDFQTLLFENENVTEKCLDAIKDGIILHNWKKKKECWLSGCSCKYSKGQESL